MVLLIRNVEPQNKCKTINFTQILSEGAARTRTALRPSWPRREQDLMMGGLHSEDVKERAA